MHEKVREKIAQTRLTNVYVMLAHVIEEAAEAYEKAPNGSELEVLALAALTTLQDIAERIAGKIHADYGRQNGPER
jgi:hypothetical protein